jgi:hypothetical protein
MAAKCHINPSYDGQDIVLNATLISFLCMTITNTNHMIFYHSDNLSHYTPNLS